MDIHRSRFVPYPYSGISAVAFSRSSDIVTSDGLPQPALKLAIGRANGDIELWNPQQGSWVQEIIFPGDNASIDGLLWTREADEKDIEGRAILGQHRLFSIATSPNVTEWDLALGIPKRKSTGNFNQVWCFAAQPVSQGGNESEAQSQDLVVGCIDGAIVLLSTADNDLTFKRFLARISGKHAKCVSITYQTRDRVLAGFADSTIRVLDVRNGSTLRTMSLGSSIPGAPRNKLVWQVRCLPNGDIVSGDSTGDVVFWDGKTYSLIQRLSVDESDCLDLVVSADGKSVFKGSLDGKITIFQHTTNTNGRQTWTKSQHRKIHQGEVKTMSAYDTNGMSVMVSGGSDLAPVVTPLRQFGKENGRSLVSLPQRSPVASARHARLLVSWWEQSISIWRMTRSGSNELSAEPQPPRKLVAKIELNANDYIQSAAVSDDGRLLAACTSTSVKVFQLKRRVDGEGLAIRKMEVPKSLSETGARLLEFSPDGKWLAAVLLDNEVHVVRLTADPSHPKQIRVLEKVAELDRDVRQLTTQTGFREYERAISRLTFSPDSSVLVAADLSGFMDSWLLEGHEDLTAPAVDIAKDGPTNKDADDTSDSDSSDHDDEEYVFFGQHWADNPAGHLLPKLDSAPLVLSFRPSSAGVHGRDLVNGNPGVHSTRHNPHARSHETSKGPHRLWVMTSRHQMYEFDVLAGRLSDWSRRNPTSALPEDFAKLKDRVIGAVWDVKSRAERIWLYGSSWMFMLNVGTDLQSQQSKKQRRQSESTPAQISTKKQKFNSGAGSKMHAHHQTGLPETVRRYEDGAWRNVPLDRLHHTDDAMDMDEDDDEALLLLRVTGTGSGSEQPQQLTKIESQTTPERNWWFTLQYRSILGIVPLIDTSIEGDERPLEVVLVERPLWEAREAKK